MRYRIEIGGTTYGHQQLWAVVYRLAERGAMVDIMTTGPGRCIVAIRVCRRLIETAGASPWRTLCESLADAPDGWLLEHDIMVTGATR